eukprot:7341145-Pyramimonas_sp.AAC.1
MYPASLTHILPPSRGWRALRAHPPSSRAIGGRGGHIPSSLARLADAAGMLPLPSRDWRT